MRQTITEQIAALKEAIAGPAFGEKLAALYGEENLKSQTARYLRAVSGFRAMFPDSGINEELTMLRLEESSGLVGHDAEIERLQIYSAPGRTEIGGNHTDHQNGRVVAAAVSDDVIAVCLPRDSERVRIFSEGFGLTEALLPDQPMTGRNRDLIARPGTTRALVYGVLCALAQNGRQVGGFDAYVTSDVAGGSGMSSSAAFETLIGTVVSGMFNGGEIPPEEIARAGQIAENEYFGKPSGLMDQMACAEGAVCFMDFQDPKAPEVRRIPFDPEACGYAMFLTDTRSSHADLTDEYAGIPIEMCEAAGVFGQERLRGVTMEDLLAHADAVRRAAGDRALLRAIHFVREDQRAEAEAEALTKGDMAAFLALYRESAASSFRFLQNVFSRQDPREEPVAAALAVSEEVLRDASGARLGEARVHGGGFAGTVQAFVQLEAADKYQAAMDAMFGRGACRKVRIRAAGGIRLW